MMSVFKLNGDNSLLACLVLGTPSTLAVCARVSVSLFTYARYESFITLTFGICACCGSQLCISQICRYTPNLSSTGRGKTERIVHGTSRQAMQCSVLQLCKETLPTKPGQCLPYAVLNIHNKYCCSPSAVGMISLM